MDRGVVEDEFRRSRHRVEILPADPVQAAVMINALGIPRGHPRRHRTEHRRRVGRSRLVPGTSVRATPGCSSASTRGTASAAGSSRRGPATSSSSRTTSWAGSSPWIPAGSGSAGGGWPTSRRTRCAGRTWTWGTPSSSSGWPTATWPGSRRGSGGGEYDIRTLRGDDGIFVAPPLWAEGPPIYERDRAQIPMTELWTYVHVTMQRLEAVPPGSPVRLSAFGQPRPPARSIPGDVGESAGQSPMGIVGSRSGTKMSNERPGLPSARSRKSPGELGRR